MTATVETAVADLRRANADLQQRLDEALAERDEALEQQTATAEVLGVINSSPGDLAPVFDAMLDKAMGLCTAAFGILWTYDGEHLHAAAYRSVPKAYAEFISQGPHQADLDPLTRRFLDGEHFRHGIDVAESEPYRSGNPFARALVDLGGGRSVLSVPLRKDSALLGLFIIYRQEVRPFSDTQVALLQNFAAQAVIAMENARLITETREALEQQTATAEILRVISRSPTDLQPTLDAIAASATILTGAVNGAVSRFDGSLIHFGAHYGWTPEELEAVRRDFPRPPDRQSTTGRAILTREVVHVPDVTADAEYGLRSVLQTAMRTGLSVPILQDGNPVGAITVTRREAAPFSEAQIGLLKSFADQAVIAIENVRLFNETREALEQQTATAEVLQVINSLPGDLAPVFDAMLEKAISLCEAAFGMLRSYDGERFNTLAARSVPEAYAEFLQENRGLPPTGTGLQRLVEGAPFVHSADAMAEEGYSGPVWRAMVELGRARAVLAVPLHKDDGLVGSITVYRQEARPFSDKQIALLQNFAAQAVIAMENARLISETREALEQQTATTEVLQVINSSPGDLAPVFDAILEKARALCGAAHGSLSLYDGERFRAVAVNSPSEELTEQLRIGVPGADSPLLRPLLDGARFVHTRDLAEIDHPQARAAVELAGAHTGLLVPLRKDDVLLGLLSAVRMEVRPFSDKEIALLQNFAAQAVIAMENARLMTETREALEQQTATAEVLGVINSSPGDLAPVFDAILEKAHTLCGAVHGALGTYESDHFRAVAIRGYSRPLEERLRQGFRGSDNPIIRPLLHGARLVHIPDLAEIDHPIPKAVVELGGFHTALFVPLRKDDVLLGLISAARQEVRPFSEKEIALIENFAAQAVIAMENARLLGELRARTDEVAGWNRELEARVAAQLAEIERTGKLRRFLAPQLADLIVAQGDESILESHRREIVVVFCDLRGFTGFAERVEPEEVMVLLRDYHAAMGPIVARFEGTIDHYGGDGIMVFFNDPLPTPDPARRAIDMAVAMRAAAQDLLKTWRRHGHEIGFGVGISQGYATLGQIGFAERMDYTAIGTVTNLAARLCAEAKDGQILVSRRVAVSVESGATLEEIGDLSLKGLSQAVAVYNVVAAGAEGSAS